MISDCWPRTFSSRTERQITPRRELAFLESQHLEGSERAEREMGNWQSGSGNEQGPANPEQRGKRLEGAAAEFPRGRMKGPGFGEPAQGCRQEPHDMTLAKSCASPGPPSTCRPQCDRDPGALGLLGPAGRARVPYLLEVSGEGDEGAVGLAQLEADAVGVAVRLQALLGDLAVGQPHADPQLSRRARPRAHAPRRPEQRHEQRQQQQQRRGGRRGDPASAGRAHPRGPGRPRACGKGRC